MLPADQNVTKLISCENIKMRTPELTLLFYGWFFFLRVEQVEISRR